MKRLALPIVVLVIITLLSGCLTSLHPLFTEKDLVFNSKLTGKWFTTKDGDTLIFEKGTANTFKGLPAALQGSADKAYVLTIIGNDKTINKYFAFLVKIGNGFYFDYYPIDSKQQLEYDDFYREQFVKMHSFYKVEFSNDNSIAISEFDDSFLHKLIDDKQVRMKHEVRADGSVFITASTEELQQYVMKYGNTPGAYSSNRDIYTKIP